MVLLERLPPHSKPLSSHPLTVTPYFRPPKHVHISLDTHTNHCIHNSTPDLPPEIQPPIEGPNSISCWRYLTVVSQYINSWIDNCKYDTYQTHKTNHKEITRKYRICNRTRNMSYKERQHTCMGIFVQCQQQWSQPSIPHHNFSFDKYKHIHLHHNETRIQRKLIRQYYDIRS